MLLTIIVWGFILFILGVGATYLWDVREPIRAKLLERAAKRQALLNARLPKSNPRRPTSNPPPARKPINSSSQGQANTLQDLIDEAHRQLEKDKNDRITRHVVMPGKTKVGFHKPGDTRELSEAFEASEHKAMTLQELVDHIERLKKK